MNNLTPTGILFKIQKIKLIKSALPMALVFVSLIATMVFDVNKYPLIENIKYVSILGLLWYFLNNVRFKIRRIKTSPEKANVYSPVSGIITKIDFKKSQIFVKHPYFVNSEIRFADDNLSFENNVMKNNNFKLEFESGKIYAFSKTGEKCQLCGLLLGNSSLKISLNKISSDLKINTRLESGVDIIGFLK